MNNKPVIRILIVDDHPAIRDGLSLLLSPEGIDVCGNAGNIDEAMKQASSCQPDLAIVDLSLGGEDGLILVSAFHTMNIPTLVYSMHEDVQHVTGAFTAGAMGYVTKRELHLILVDAIQSVVSGKRFVSTNAAFAIADQSSTQNERVLSDQERQIYLLLSHGDSTQEIANLMGISTRTVESYYARIQDKLKLTGMRELRRYAINNRLT